jgi:hypothetical protein
MQNVIAGGAIKISLFQTVPGRELEVKGLLEKGCKQEKIIDYVFFKALGTFDIALIYITDNYEVSLGKFGPIPGILKSIDLLCYSYGINTTQSLLNSIKNSNLIGLSLLKVDPSTQRAYPDIERSLREYIIEQKENRFRGGSVGLVGSIGWNEIIMIVAFDNINRIVEELLEMSSVFVRKRNLPVLAKTLSFVCINYGCMPTFSVLKKGLKHIKAHLNKYPFLRDSKIGPEGAPSVEITAKPMYADSIKKYFQREGFKAAYDLLGKVDLSFEPLPDLTWADCLATVLHFRRNFDFKGFSTSTRLRLMSNKGKSTHPRESPWTVGRVDFSYQTLSEKYGKRVAISLANHFYSFFWLIQNPIYGSAFLDMVDYPKHILDTGNELDDIARLRLAHGVREVLRYGSELRLCGTFQSIEEETGKFSEIQGGGQRALLALEYLPYRVFRRLKRSWNGFIITSHYDKLMHINEVIQVPIYTLWSPQNWWTLYHEIAHIWIDVSPEVVSYEVPEIEEFLVIKSNPRHWLGKLTELAAEVIGFEMGFFGDYDLFFRLYWKHISDIDPSQRTMFDFGDYAMRSFFTLLFWRGFRNNVTIAKAERDFMDVDFLYREFLKHLEKIEESIGRRIFHGEEHFWAAEKAQQCSELYAFASHLASHVANNHLRLSKKHLNSRNTEEIIRHLSRQRIWWDKISCPEAVIYRILKKKNVSFETSMATVITFWNQQVGVLKQRFQ